eukprot:scaffold45382_cov27-Tisochrysis_lutea.AAC.1
MAYTHTHLHIHTYTHSHRQRSLVLAATGLVVPASMHASIRHREITCPAGTCMVLQSTLKKRLAMPMRDATVEHCDSAGRHCTLQSALIVQDATTHCGVL